MDNEDEFYGSANANLDELENFRKHNRELVSVFSNNKAFASMLMAAKNGKDPYEWMAENLGADIAELSSNPEYAKKISEAAKRYSDGQSKMEATKAEYESNVKKTLDCLKKLQKETGWDNDKCFGLASKVYDIIDEGTKGLITEETFRMVMNGMNYDSDVKSARSEGEVAGRNAKIKEQLKRERGVEGMPPTLSTAKGQPEKPSVKRKSYWEGVK